MELDIIQNISKRKKLFQKQLSEKVCPPFTPSNLEVAKFWDKISNPLPPRTYMYIMSIPSDITFRSKGMSLIGFEDQQTFTARDHLMLTHDNQSLLVFFQTTCLYGVIINNPELLKDKGVVYCTIRGIKHTTVPNHCFLVHQVAFPIQYDSNGLITKYFCSYRIIGDYNGEAFQTQVYTSPQFTDEQYQLREILNATKKKMLRILGFTRMEEEIIRYIALGQPEMSSAKIAEEFGLSVKTIRNHRNSINSKAKDIFPFNHFKDTEDVVSYLKKQFSILRFKN